MVEPLTKKSLMLFGKYQGFELGNVPARYFLWIYVNLNLREDLKRYIEQNREAFEQEVRQANREKRR